MSIASSSAVGQVDVSRGREVHQWYLAGNLDAIWAARSPQADGNLRDRETLAANHRRFLESYGSERSLVSERVQPYRGNVHYTRVASHGFSEPVHTVWIFDEEGRVAGMTTSGPSVRVSRASAGDEDLTPYVVMCGGGLCISLFLGLLLFAIVRGVRSGERKQGAAWARAARGLGLTLGDWTPEMRSDLDRLTGTEAPEEPMTTQPMRGIHAGRTVVVQVRMRRGSFSSPNPADRLSTYWTEATTALDPPLVARLRVRTRDRSLEWLGALGDAEALRTAYEISALDQDYAARLLADPAVARALLDASHRGGQLRITDHGVVAVLDGLVTDQGRLRGALELATHVAAVLEGARARVAPPAAVAALDGPWGELARSRGWLHDRVAGRLTGRREGLRFELRAEPMKKWCTRVTVWLTAPAGLGLWLSREGALSGVARFIGMQDIEVGDRRFDGRFIVQGRPEAAVRALLTEPVRDTLIAIQDQALRFEVKDDHVVALVGHLMTDPGRIDDALAHLCFVAGELSGASPGVGPYRA